MYRVKSERKTVLRQHWPNYKKETSQDVTGEV